MAEILDKLEIECDIARLQTKVSFYDVAATAAKIIVETCPLDNFAEALGIYFELLNKKKIHIALLNKAKNDLPK
jgi:hypothetical protein